MPNAKKTARARVYVGYDGRVQKWFLGPEAAERYANEIQVLSYLESKECPFVPKIIKRMDTELYIATTNCGQKVEHLSQIKSDQLFDELERYGVRHEDQAIRNITYNARMGRFCIIDFEYATILEEGFKPSPKMTPHPNRDDWK